MPPNARMGYAKRSGTTRLHAPGRVLPIIIVPGIGSTRLVDEDGKLVWNPLGRPLGSSPGTFAANLERLENPNELYPDEKEYEVEAKRDGVEKITNFYQLLPDMYQELATRLAGLEIGEFTEYHVRPKVYCCGYDWRQDCAKSALRLAALVERALRETGERKVVIVAHSLGGLVSRYYCRVLGGESRVHQLFLLGSPTLGAPTAYLQLKNGLNGLYVKDMISEALSGDALGAVAEGVDMAGRILSAAATMAGGDPVGGAFNLFGQFYMPLCLSTGRLLSRDETKYFARQIPSLYQMMPNSVFCRTNKNWVVFDPMATGHLPVGHMTVFPTLLDSVVEIPATLLDVFAGSASRAGDELRDGANAFFRPQAAERTSPLARRNRSTLIELVEQIVNDLRAIHEEEEWARGQTLGDAGMKIGEQAARMFADCESSRRLYDDIYTGLLDWIDHRAMCAANLALAYRFDDALTVKKGPRIQNGVLDLLLQLLGPVINLFKTIGIAIDKSIQGFGDESWGMGEAQVAKDDSRAREEARRKPTVYMHPRTVNIYGDSLQVDAGCFLLPTDFVSNHDSNEVRWQMIPDFVALSAFMVLGSSSTGPFSERVFGDGTVPAASANPSAELLSHDFLNKGGKAFPVGHGSLTKEDQVIEFIERRMEGLLLDFLAC